MKSGARRAALHGGAYFPDELMTRIPAQATDAEVTASEYFSAQRLRQLVTFQTSDRAGVNAEPMQAVVAQLRLAEMIAVSAYVASQWRGKHETRSFSANSPLNCISVFNRCSQTAFTRDRNALASHNTTVKENS